MTRYAYRTVDVKSNVVLEDIDLQQVQFTTKLSAPGDLDGTLFVPESQRGRLLDSATFPGRTGLYVLRDDIPVWGGIIWKRSWDESKATFRLGCKSWESYAYHVTQRLTKNYTNTDQLIIARDLINDAGIPTQSGITAPASGTSGRLRERHMFAYEFKSIGLELEQLAGLEDGFDYTVQSYVLPSGEFGRRYVFGYPRLGRTANLDPGANSLTLDYPGNLAPFALVEDAETGAWRIFSIGAGEGSLMKWKTAQDTTYDSSGWPLLDEVTQYKDVSVDATLQSHANEDLKKSRPPIDSWTFQLAPDSDVKLSDISIGDSAVFRLRSRRWENSLQMIRRIAEITVTPGDAGELEKIQLGLEEERA